jgi:hypothetical protein
MAKLLRKFHFSQVVESQSNENSIADLKDVPGRECQSFYLEAIKTGNYIVSQDE